MNKNFDLPSVPPEERRLMWKGKCCPFCGERITPITIKKYMEISLHMTIASGIIGKKPSTPDPRSPKFSGKTPAS